MVGIRHTRACALAFLKTTLPVKEERFRFISHKLAVANLRYHVQHMSNHSYVITQTQSDICPIYCSAFDI